MSYDPGPELDLEIAKKIFHYVIIVETSGEVYSLNSHTNEKRPIEQFSIDTNEAYKVIQFMNQHGYMYDIRSFLTENGGLLWTAGFFNILNSNNVIRFQGKYLAHAVCVAALSLIDKI